MNEHRRQMELHTLMDALSQHQFFEALEPEMKMDQDEAAKRYRLAIGMPRRIDFLFSMTFMSTACLTQELFGKPAMMGDATSSDHYGVLNTYTYQRTDCEQR